ncbi:MAG: hypothetical protein M1826_001791 [Phylliscum demangeonii]|nr:MAG: hypothetical protein M1826_001791 [Phylliscum demangeonii]
MLQRPTVRANAQWTRRGIDETKRGGPAEEEAEHCCRTANYQLTAPLDFAAITSEHVANKVSNEDVELELFVHLVRSSQWSATLPNDPASTERGGSRGDGPARCRGEKLEAIHLRRDGSKLAKRQRRQCSPNQPSPRAASPLPSFESVAIEPGSSASIPALAPAPSTTAPRNAASSTALVKETEELKAKLRFMEKKRMEDRERLRSMERIQGERDKYEAIIQKLQAKYQPQQQETADLRKRLADADAKLAEALAQQAEHDDVLEMATLDREMAEESAEVLKTELEASRQKTEELQLEVEVLREENQAYSEEMTAEEKASQGWLQMERSNERLREALLRLRDLTQQQEAELKDQVRSLEEDVLALSNIKELYETTRKALRQSEENVEELKQQLESALGAEDMIEELTERNMNMREQMDELRAAIEDLESLKELSDELEINHVETEKQMQDEIDYRDAVVVEQSRRAARQEQAIEDYEYTIGRFRQLVTDLQSDLEDMRASQQITENEAEELTSRSRAMMDLNMKLQLSASKTQVKAIDLELRRLEAQEAAEHLAIVQHFLPEAFQADRESVMALLRFRRVAFKARLLHTFVKERAAGQGIHGQEYQLFAGCDVLDKLTWMSAMCDRFIRCIQSSSTERFAKFENALYELEPVERALNGWIDSLRREELDETRCAEQLQRSIALMSHLAEIHLAESLESYTDDFHLRAVLTQSYLENTATAMGRLKDVVQNKIPVSEGNEAQAREFGRKADSIVSGARSAKVVASKAIRAVEELQTRSLSLAPDTLPLFEVCEDIARGLAECSRGLGQDVVASLSEEGLVESRTYDDLDGVIARMTSRVFDDKDQDFFRTLAHNLRILQAKLGDTNQLASDLTQALEFERAPAPWAVRAQALRAAEHVPDDVQQRIRSLKGAVHESSTQLKLREQALDESAVKIELLEARMRDAGKRTDKIAALERGLAESRLREKELLLATERQAALLERLETDKDRWLQQQAAAASATGSQAASTNKNTNNKRRGGDAGSGHADDALPQPAMAQAMTDLQHEIRHLQGAVRYLRDDNEQLRISSATATATATGPIHAGSSGTGWLHAPLTRPSRSPKADRAHLVRAEAHDVLHELLALATSHETDRSAAIYDLRRTPEDRLAWRPARSTPQWHVRRQRELWERWREWKDDVVAKGRDVTRARRRGRRRRGGGGRAGEDGDRKASSNGAAVLPNKSRGTAPGPVQVRVMHSVGVDVDEHGIGEEEETSAA